MLKHTDQKREHRLMTRALVFVGKVRFIGNDIVLIIDRLVVDVVLLICFDQ